MGRIVGIENITRYLGLSESTVMDMIQNQGMPAKKDDKTNIWEIDQARLDRWLADPQRDAKMTAVEEQTAAKKAEKSEPETEPETPLKTEPKLSSSKKKRSSSKKKRRK